MKVQALEYSSDLEPGGDGIRACVKGVHLHVGFAFAAGFYANVIGSCDGSCRLSGHEKKINLDPDHFAVEAAEKYLRNT